jgi:hypothetical protein
MQLVEPDRNGGDRGGAERGRAEQELPPVHCDVITDRRMKRP